MVSRILHTSYVIDFMDCDFDTDHISAILKEEADRLLQRFPIDSLAEWEVQFSAIYGPKYPIRVYTKMPSYTKEKQKLLTIQLPIPTNDIVAWGVEPRQHIRLGIHPNELKNTTQLEVHYTSFTNRTDYILDSMRRGIRCCFEQGFRVNSIPIKLGKAVMGPGEVR